MSTVKWHYDASPNVGNVDKIVRYAVGIALIAPIFVLSTPTTWILLAPLVAIPVVISAITGWDPIYALFQKLPTVERSLLDPKPSREREDSLKSMPA